VCLSVCFHARESDSVCPYFMAERMTDDGIAIHGAYALVAAKLNSTSIVLQTAGVYIPDVGDTFRLYNKAFVPASGDYKVAGMAQMERNWRPKYNTSKSLPRDGYKYAGPYYAVSFTKSVPVDVGFDWVMNNADRNGNGFVLRNNSIHDHRARGMLIKASRGLIEENLINGSTLGGLIITPELSWGEADFVRDVTVRNNRIMNVGYGKQSYGAIALGATAYINHTRVFDSGKGHRNVSFISNHVSDIDTVALWITSASGVRLENNRFASIWKQPTWATCCPPYPVPLNTVIFATEADGIEATGNCIVDVGKYATTLVNITPTAAPLAPRSQVSWTGAHCQSASVTKDV
jgi:hypothetical protein